VQEIESMKRRYHAFVEASKETIRWMTEGTHRFRFESMIPAE
jgi:hypothetical protein